MLLQWDSFGVTYNVSVGPHSEGQTGGLKFLGREDATVFLARLRGHEGFERDLRGILGDLGHNSDVSRTDAPTLIAQAASALAAGTIQIAPAVPEHFVVRAETWVLLETQSPRMLCFDRLDQARRLLMQMRGGAEEAVGLVAVLEDDAGHKKLEPPQAVEWLAGGLFSKRLALEPIGFRYDELRLYRIRRMPREEVSKPQPQYASSPSPRVQSAASALPAARRPKLPRVGKQTSPQAHALRHAARGGAPFCEECAAAAAARQAR